MQRLRIRFGRGPEIKYISHLDIVRLWQRALNRADMPLAYSEGFNPHPRISVAAPLALGITSEAELMDIVLSRVISPHFFTAAVSQQLPGGIQMEQVQPIPLPMPSLQSLIQFAEYRVEVATEKTKEEIETGIDNLLSLEHLPWQHQRDTGPRKYDLRPLVNDLQLLRWTKGQCAISMRLLCGSNGSGRPEQVAAALGFNEHPSSMHRTRLILRIK